MRLNTALAPQNSGNWCKHHPAVPMAPLPWCLSLGSVETLSSLQNPANLSYGENRERGDSPVMTSPVKSFSLEKLLHHREEKGEFKQRQHNAILLLICFKPVRGSPLHQVTCLSLCALVCLTLLVGVLNSGKQRVTHLGGLHNPP